MPETEQQRERAAAIEKTPSHKLILHVCLRQSSSETEQQREDTLAQAHTACVSETTTYVSCMCSSYRMRVAYCMRSHMRVSYCVAYCKRSHMRVSYCVMRVSSYYICVLYVCHILNTPFSLYVSSNMCPCVLKCVSSYSDSTLSVSTYLRGKKRVATERIHSHTQEPLVYRQQPL